MSQWASVIAEQQNGMIAYMAIVGVLTGYWVFLRNHYPTPIRFGTVVIYLVGLLALSREFWNVLILVVMVGWCIWMIAKWIKLKPIWIILIIATIARLPSLGESFWYDETFTAGVSSLPIPNLMTVTLSDVHPPLWYLLEHGITGVLGNSEIAFRLPSLIFGVLAVYLVYKLARAWRFKYSVAIMSASFMAVMPTMIYYSTEARAYSLLLCSVLGMLIAIVEKRYLLFAFTAIITMYAHNIGFAYVGVIGIAWFLFSSNRLRLSPVLIMVAVAGGVWLPVMFSQSKDISDGFWLTDLNIGGVFAPIINNTIGASVPSDILPLVSIPVIVMSGLGLWRSLKMYKQRPLFLVVMLGVPALLALVSALWRNVYLERALLPSTALLIICWSDFFVNLNHKDKNVLKFTALPSLLIVMVGAYGSRFDTRGMLINNCIGLPAYATTLPASFTANYYLPVVYVWSRANDLNQTLTETAKQAMEWDFREFDELSGRVCLIDAHNALNSQIERDYVQSILEKYPHYTRNVADKDFFDVNIHIVDLGA